MTMAELVSRIEASLRHTALTDEELQRILPPITEELLLDEQAARAVVRSAVSRYLELQGAGDH